MYFSSEDTASQNTMLMGLEKRCQYHRWDLKGLDGVDG